jgi:hypothetical protein
MDQGCSSTVANLIAIGIMLPGGLISLFAGGFLSDWLMGMRDPRSMTEAEHHGGCGLTDKMPGSAR